MIKNSNDSINYQQTADVYKKFESQFNLNEKVNSEAFRNFKLKTIYNCFQQKKFSEAYSNLDIYIKNIKDEITSSNLENNILDIKTTK